MSIEFVKTKPYQHQVDALKRGMLRPSYGYLMEMGTGKSKVLIDNYDKIGEKYYDWNSKDKLE